MPLLEHVPSFTYFETFFCKLNDGLRASREYMVSFALFTLLFLLPYPMLSRPENIRSHLSKNMHARITISNIRSKRSTFIPLSIYAKYSSFAHSQLQPSYSTNSIAVTSSHKYRYYLSKISNFQVISRNKSHRHPRYYLT